MRKMCLPGAFVNWMIQGGADQETAGCSPPESALLDVFANGRDMRAGQNYTRRITLPDDFPDDARQLLRYLADKAEVEGRGMTSRALYHAARSVRKRVDAIAVDDVPSPRVSMERSQEGNESDLVAG